MVRQDAVGQKIKMLHLAAGLDGLADLGRSRRFVKEPPSMADVGGHEINTVSIDGPLRHKCLPATDKRQVTATRAFRQDLMLQYP